MDREFIKKAFAVKADDATLAENRISVVPSVMGAMDDCGDVIFPGAFVKAIPAFLKEGFVPDTHEWEMGRMVAFPISMSEDGALLKSEAQFHSTPDAQDVRTICKERLAFGLSVGASIGFSVYGKGRAWFDNGEALLQYAKDIGADLTLFDTKGITAYDDMCRAITTVDRLYEYSIVPVPMMRDAMVMDAKSYPATERDFELFLRDSGFSRKNATAIALHGFKALLRDAESDEHEEKKAAVTPDTTMPPVAEVVPVVIEEPAPEPASETPAPEPVTVTLTPPEPVNLTLETSPEVRARQRYQAGLEYRRFLQLSAKGV
jgi:phage head maturation protease